MTWKTRSTQTILGLAVVLLTTGAILGQALEPEALEPLDAAASLETADPQPLRAPLEEYLNNFQEAMNHGTLTPDLTDHNEIRPGQRILVRIPNDGIYICSISFLFNDTSTSQPIDYAGTAGHCLMPSTEVATHGVPAPYDASRVEVLVCNDNCLLGGFLSDFLWTAKDLGEVVYARQSNSTASSCPAGGVGNDFGLIRIPPDYLAKSNVNPAMAVWHGPTGQNSNQVTGEPLVHYGNGVTMGSTFATGARVATSLNNGIPCSLQAIGHIYGGDSGSAISHAGTSAGLVLHGEEALGTITHTLGVLVGFGTPILGTTIDRGIQMAWDDAGIDIQLVTV